MDAPCETAALHLHLLGLRVYIASTDARATRALLANFGAMLAPERTGNPDLRYRVECAAASSYALTRDDGDPEPCADIGDVLYALEKDLTVELQRRRKDLYFLHAAALEWRGHAFLLAAASGSGKSTTAWALLHRGFGYLSDELAPIDLRAMAVHPFAHALCLKHDPPAPHALPEHALRLGARIHVPIDALPAATCPGPLPLAAVVLVQFQPALVRPRIRALGHAEASARVYVTALNPLAHPNSGLDAAVRIAARVPCYAVETAALGTTAESMARLADQVLAAAPKPANRATPGRSSAPAAPTRRNRRR